MGLLVVFKRKLTPLGVFLTMYAPITKVVFAALVA